MKSFSFRRVWQIMYLLFHQFKGLNIYMIGVYLFSILLFMQTNVGTERGGSVVYWITFMIFPIIPILLGLLQHFITQYENNLQMIPASSGEKTVAIFGYSLLLFLIYPLVMSFLFVFFEDINGANRTLLIDMFNTFILLFPYGLVVLMCSFYTILIARKPLMSIVVLIVLVVTTFLLSISLTPSMQKYNYQLAFALGFEESVLNQIKWGFASVLMLLGGYLGVCSYNAFNVREQR